MSIEVSVWVWKESGSRGNDRLVLLAIADHANADGTGAWPPDDTLAAMCKVDRATIRRCRNRLRGLGELDWKSGKQAGHSNRYRVVMDPVAQQVLRDDVNGGADCATPPVVQNAPPGSASETEGWRTGAPPGSALVRHNPSIEPTDEPSGEPPASLTLVDAPQAVVVDHVREVFDAWVRATGRTPQCQYNAARQRLIRAALAAYPLDYVLAATRGWRHFAHNRGDVTRDNPEGRSWTDIGLLLRDAEHIEKFADAELRNLPEPGMKRQVPESWTGIAQAVQDRQRDQGIG